MILRLENISKRFGGLRALKQVSLTVPHGEIFGLIGANGAGKTTVLNVVAGVHKPDAGAVYLADQNVTGLDPEALCKKGLARTFQIPHSFPRLTVLENVLVAATFGGGRSLMGEAVGLARQLLEFVGFPLPVDTLAANLNAAQLKRLDLARALASQPKLLLLDEIAAGLTPLELMDLIRLMQKIRQTGVAIIVVEHLMRVIMRVCDRVAFLQSGEIISEGTPEEVSHDARVVEAYLGVEPFGYG